MDELDSFTIDPQQTDIAELARDLNDMKAHLCKFLKDLISRNRRDFADSASMGLAYYFLFNEIIFDIFDTRFFNGLLNDLNNRDVIVNGKTFADRLN